MDYVVLQWESSKIISELFLLDSAARKPKHMHCDLIFWLTLFLTRLFHWTRGFSQIIHKHRPILHRCSQQLSLLLPDRIYGRFPTGHGSGGELFNGKSQRLQLETPVRVASINFMEYIFLNSPQKLHMFKKSLAVCESRRFVTVNRPFDPILS